MFATGQEKSQGKIKFFKLREFHFESGKIYEFNK